MFVKTDRFLYLKIRISSDFLLKCVNRSSGRKFGNVRLVERPHSPV